ncbi:hypothetical protein AAVH_04537 [Aphelenchoides avenae]|nr:hypothetical protein AAVH_04537 [Aphelenchus avenae]
MFARFLLVGATVTFMMTKITSCAPVEVSRPELEVDTDSDQAVLAAEDGVENNSNALKDDPEYEQNASVLRSAVVPYSESDQLLMLSTGDRPSVRAKREDSFFRYMGSRG